MPIMTSQRQSLANPKLVDWSQRRRPIAFGPVSLLDAIEESYIAHVAIRKSMVTLNGAGAQASHFDSKVRGLADLVEHHIAVTEDRIFDKARNSDLDLVVIGTQLDAYRAGLQYRCDLDRDGTELEDRR